jgi:hypothetical protein
MPAYFLSKNAIRAVGFAADNWKLEQEQYEFCHSMKKHMHTHKNKSKRKYFETVD